MMLSPTGPWIIARSVGAGGHHGVVWRMRRTGGLHLLLLLLHLTVLCFIAMDFVGHSCGDK